MATKKTATTAKKTQKIRRPKQEYSDKQLNKMFAERDLKATKAACLLFAASIIESKKLSIEDMCDVVTDVLRWYGNIKDHALTLNEVSMILEKQTGHEFPRYGLW